MVNCAVPSCKNDSRRQTKQNSNVTFHRFPKNEELLRKWADAIQRPDWEPSIRSFVCSAHFADNSMYFSKSGLRKLVQDAVPEFSLENVPQKHKKRKRKSSKITHPYKHVAADKKRDSIKKESSDSPRDIYRARASDCPVQHKLKKRIINLYKLSKKRRLRCNALYASLNRIRKKVAMMTGTMQDLHSKISDNSELMSMLADCGVSTSELFKGLWKRKSYSPEPQEEEEYFYSEIPADIESYIQPKNQITIYSTSIPEHSHSLTDLDVQVSVVKTEYSPRAEPEPVFIQAEVCRGCQLSDVPLVTIEDDLRELYERIAGAVRSSPDALCRGCVSALQRCQRFTDSSVALSALH